LKKKALLAWVIALIVTFNPLVGSSSSALAGDIELDYFGQSDIRLSTSEFAPGEVQSVAVFLPGGNIPRVSAACAASSVKVGESECFVPAEKLVAFLDTYPEYWSTESQLVAKFMSQDNSVLKVSELRLSDKRLFALKALRIENWSGNIIVGEGFQGLQITAKAVDQSGGFASAIFKVYSGEKMVFDSTVATTLLDASIELSEFNIGSNEVQIVASNEYGSVENKIFFQVIEPAIESLTIRSANTFYPHKDKHLDSLDFFVSASGNVDSRVYGEVLVQDSRGQVLLKSALDALGTYKYTLPGYFKGKQITGKITIKASVKLKGQKTKVTTKTVTASPKKMVESKGSVTVNAWQAKVTCGRSFNPCSRGGYNDSTNGIELYSDPIGEISHSSQFQIKVPTGTYKWQVRANGFRTSLIVAQFGAYSDFGKNIGWLPSKKMYSGAWTSAWAYGDTQGSAGWTMESDDYGSIWIESFTVNWVARALK
jgi:hypothetical protein